MFNSFHTYQELLILANILNLSPEKLVYKIPHLTPAQKLIFEKQQKMLQQGYPLDYILKKIKFLDLSITLNPQILIPREETEEWLKFLIGKFSNSNRCFNSSKNQNHTDLDSVFFRIRNLAKNNLKLIEIGCGSGVVSLSLSKFFGKVLAIDISKSAIQVTRQNCRLNKIKNIQTYQIDAGNSNIFPSFFSAKKVNILVANLPYLPKNNITQAKNNKINYEPYTALYSGFNGLSLYKKIVQNLEKLPNDSKPVLVWFELDISNIKLAKKILSTIYSKTGIYYDSYNQARILWGVL